MAVVNNLTDEKHIFRWRKLEAGQMEVKQNLIKFNNFVREKQGKDVPGFYLIFVKKLQ